SPSNWISSSLAMVVSRSIEASAAVGGYGWVEYSDGSRDARRRRPECPHFSRLGSCRPAAPDAAVRAGSAAARHYYHHLGGDGEGLLSPVPIHVHGIRDLGIHVPGSRFLWTRVLWSPAISQCGRAGRNVRRGAARGAARWPVRRRGCRAFDGLPAAA